MNYTEEQIKHHFNDSELAQMARQQATQLNESSQLESEAKSIATDFKARIESKKAQLQSLGVRVNTGFEMRVQKCLILKERPEGYNITVRLDNGHVLRRRKLLQEERQLTLTTETPPSYVAVGILPVDDTEWHVDLYQCPLNAAEFDELKTTGVEFLNWVGPSALIEG